MGDRFLGAGVTDSGELSRHGYWEPSSGPLEKQQHS